MVQQANTNSYFSQLPAWAKGAVVVFGAVVIVGTGVAITIAVKNAIKKLKENVQERQQGKEIESELKRLEKEGIKPTMTEADATSLAFQVKTGLDGCEMSGTEEIIKDTILQKVQNQADWYLLQDKFGLQMIDNCGWGTGDTQYDLKTLLLEQLDAFDWGFNLYSTLLKEGLAAKGISW